MKKGFTLIELLAVIVILAIIALIATPIILNIIDDTREGANKRSIDMYGKAVENAIMLYQMNEKVTPTDFSQIEKYIKYDGNTVKCNISIINEDGSIYLNECTVNNVQVDYEYGESTLYPGTDEIDGCVLTNDIDGDDVADNGDEVTCGSEVFYVVPNDTTAHSTATTGNVTLITKYNLDVGDIYEVGSYYCKYGDGNYPWYVSTITNPTGIQSSRALGFSGCDREIYGAMAFSETNYWSTTISDGTFVYNDQSLLYPHVENYGAYIRNMGVSVKQASLLSYVQLLEIKKIESSEGLYSNFTWTTFWLGSASDVPGGSHEIAFGSAPFSIYYANSDGTYREDLYLLENFRGVRPVIVIPESEIE